MRWPLTSLRRPTATFGDEIASVDEGLIHLRGGGIRAVLATSSLNFRSLAPEEQARAVRGFRDLLHAQDGRIQLYLRARRVRSEATANPDRPSFPDQKSYLAALTRSFINTHLSETAVYQREVYVVLSGGEDLRNPFSGFLGIARDRAAPASSNTAAAERIRYRAAAVDQQVRQMGVSSRTLDTGELTLFLQDICGHPRQSSTFRQHPARVAFRNRWFTSFVVDRYPGGEVTPGWLLPLLSFPGDLQVAIHITPLDSERILTLLHHRIRDIRADEMDSLDAGTTGRTVATLPDALNVHEALVRNEEKVFAVGLYVTVGAADPAELQTQVRALQSVCRQMMLGVVQPLFQMPQALLATWPFAHDVLGREQLMHTSAVTTLLPWLQVDLHDPAGHYWGCSRETGGLVVFDPFDERRFANANIAVLAHSGAGKSYAAAALVLSGYTRDVGAIILDPEAEYGRIVHSLGGTYLHLAAGSGHAINVLDSLRAGSGVDAMDQLSDVLDLVSLMCGRLDEVERAHLESALRQVLAAEAEPVLGDVCTVLERTQPGTRVTTILQRWVAGELGALFSAPTNVNLTADVVGFNLRDLKDEVVAPAYLLLANWLWGALRRNRRPRHLLIDEAGLLLEHEPIRRFLVRLARRIRKYGGSMILVSQNPGDFFETKDGAVLVTNPSILLLGWQKHSEARKLQVAFSLTDAQVAGLETARRGEFLLLAGTNRVPLRVMVPPWMDELIVPVR